MFKGQVTVKEAGTLSLQDRHTEICRQFAKEMDGGSFFTAWAFPAFERINSCRRHQDGGENGPLAVRSQNGRIVVKSEHGSSLNISDEAGTKNADPAWGVLLFLNRVVDGRCQIIDMQLLAPDREYELGGERLAWLGAVDEAQGLEFIRALSGRDVERKLRKELVFALYLFRGRAAVSELIRLARQDPEADVRKQAIFWLGQKASAGGGQGPGRRARLTRGRGNKEAGRLRPQPAARRHRHAQAARHRPQSSPAAGEKSGHLLAGPVRRSPRRGLVY